MKALITDGVVGQIHFDHDAQPGEVTVPAFVWAGDTTPDGGQTFYRNGVLVVATVPDEVPLWAFRTALVLSGITEAQVNALIAGLSEPAKTVANIQWNYGNFIERGHSLIGQLGSQLGLSSEQIDDVFRLAASLK